MYAALASAVLMVLGRGGWRALPRRRPKPYARPARRDRPLSYALARRSPRSARCRFFDGTRSVLAESESGMEASEWAGSPPVDAAGEFHRGRDEQAPDQSGVDEHGEREPDAEEFEEADV